MISLIELLHSISKESKEGLVNVDDWRWPDVDHLYNMGFEFGDDFHLVTNKEPRITVYKKKEVDEASGGKREYFYVEEKNREKKRFKAFSEVIDYFDTYPQPELDKNM
jgi:hypothetical protein